MSLLHAHAVPPMLTPMSLHKVADPAAVCNDGTAASYYFRDCPRPETECTSWSKDWLIVFADGDSADTCFDDMTCAARKRSTPDKMSSAHLNASLSSPEGIFSFSGEGAWH